MLKIYLFVLFTLSFQFLNAQKTSTPKKTKTSATKTKVTKPKSTNTSIEVVNKKITKKNSWLKLGFNAGAPVGDTHKASDIKIGIDVRGQYLINPNIGIGVTVGYNHYFGKSNIKDFGTIPLAAFIRYYQKKQGIFLGADFGYSFVSNMTNVGGGLYLSPQLGYHNINWNVYAYYQHTFHDVLPIQSLGIGASYNLRFK